MTNKEAGLRLFRLLRMPSRQPPSSEVFESGFYEKGQAKGDFGRAVAFLLKKGLATQRGSTIELTTKAMDSTRSTDDAWSLYA